MKDKIEAGDLVSVEFNQSTSLFRCRVLSMPVATGDSWKLKGEDGSLHYVQMFERMDLLKE